MSRDFRHSEKVTWLLLPNFLNVKIKGSCHEILETLRKLLGSCCPNFWFKKIKGSCHKIFECTDDFLGSCCLLPPVGSPSFPGPCGPGSGPRSGGDAGDSNPSRHTVCIIVHREDHTVMHYLCWRDSSIWMIDTTAAQHRQLLPTGTKEKLHIKK